LTAAERWDRAGHRPFTIWLTARTEVAYLLERELFDRGCLVHVLADDVESHLLPELAKMSSAAGLITICTSASDEAAERDRARQLVGADAFFDIDPQSLSTKDVEAKDQIARLLESRGIIRPDERGLSGDGI
jgi:adenylylsulfate kinase-like enzyme